MNSLHPFGKSENGITTRVRHHAAGEEYAPDRS